MSCYSCNSCSYGCNTSCNTPCSCCCPKIKPRPVPCGAAGTITCLTCPGTGCCPTNICSSGYNTCNSCYNSCNNCCNSYNCMSSCHKKKHKKHKRSSSDSDSESCHKKKKKCCCCIKYYPCLRTKCGFFSFTVGVTASPTSYSGTGTVITYTYTITNTGTEPMVYPILICDSFLGGQQAPFAYVAPCGGTLIATRDYTTTATDVANVSGIVSSVTIYSDVSKCKYLCSQPATVTVTNTSV